MLRAANLLEHFLQQLVLTAPGFSAALQASGAQLPCVTCMVYSKLALCVFRLTCRLVTGGRSSD